MSYAGLMVWYFMFACSDRLKVAFLCIMSFCIMLIGEAGAWAGRADIL